MVSQQDVPRFDLRRHTRLLQRYSRLILAVAVLFGAIATSAVAFQKRESLARARVELLDPARTIAALPSPNPFLEKAFIASVIFRDEVAGRLGLSRRRLPVAIVKPIPGTSLMDWFVSASSAEKAKLFLQTYISTYTELRHAETTKDLEFGRELVQVSLDESKKSAVETEAEIRKLPASERGPVSDLLTTRLTVYLGQRSAYQQQLRGIDKAIKTGLVRVVAPPFIPAGQRSKGLIPTVLVGVFLGLLVGVGTAYAVNAVRSIVRSRHDVLDCVPDVPFLGEVGGTASGPTFASSSAIPGSGYENVAAAILAATRVARCDSIVVTGPHVSAAAHVTAGVGRVIATRGMKAVVIDGDLQTHSLAATLAARVEPNMVGRWDLEGTNVSPRPIDTSSTTVPGLLTSSDGPHGGLPLSAAVLSAPGVRDCLRSRPAGATIQFAAAGSPLTTGEVACLQDSVDAAVIVVSAGSVARHRLVGTVDRLRELQIPVLGIVLTDIDERDRTQ